MKLRSFRGAGLATFALLFAALVASACASNAPQDTLRENLGEKAEDQASLFWLVFWIAVGIFFIVEGLLLVLVLKYRRRRSHAGTVPAQVHGNTRLEIAWTIAPALLLMVIAVPTVAMIWDQSGHEDVPDALNVRVVGKQWWWEIHYTDSQVVTANELQIPTGKVVNFDLESSDVIHSYWAPKLAGKQDLIPGQTTELSFRADEPGVYLGQCTEYCGLSHANMRLVVIAKPQAEFDAWLQAQAQPAADPAAGSDAAAGKDLFLGSACIGCHTVKGTVAAGTVGPDLTHFADRIRFAGAMFDNTPENLAAWLRDPPGVKPGSKMPNLNLSEDDIRILVAYLESLH
jgi:cytochrome c oxidase subunit 2